MSQQNPSAAEATAEIGALPDELLLSILGRLSVQERHTAAVHVCRRWRQLVNAPPLLAASHFSLAEGAAGLLESFYLFLAAHGEGHVRRLWLEVEGPSPVVARLLAACAPSLEDLKLQCSASLPSCRWAGLERMPRLRRLSIACFYGCQLDADLAQLGGLERLELHSVVEEVASLPPNLTLLSLYGYRGEALPRQVSSLPRLRALHLWDVQFDAPGGLRGLEPLSACLTQLVVRHCAEVPPALSALTSLVRLCALVEEVGEGDDDWDWLEHEEPGEHVLAALPRLARLRHLMLGPMPGCLEPPRALAGLQARAAAAPRLHRLESFAWVTTDLPWQAPLPGGAWLAGLRRLAAPAGVLASSLEPLMAARALAFLAIDCFPGCGANSPALAMLLTWALSRPRLSHLVLGCPSAQWAQAAAAALRLGRPSLRDCGMCAFHSLSNMPPGVLDPLPPLPAASAAEAAATATAASVPASPEAPPSAPPAAAGGSVPGCSSAPTRPLVLQSYTNRFQYQRLLVQLYISTDDCF